jgi:hypothetical protein
MLLYKARMCVEDVLTNEVAENSSHRSVRWKMF